METKLLAEIETTTADLVQVISSFPQEEINKVSFEGSWTPGQVSDHVNKALAGCVKNLYGITKPTTRNPDQHVQQLRDMFLDFTTKMKSPEFILPSDKPLQKEVLIKTATGALTKISEAVKSLDMTETCTDFELPGGGGQLTRLEWTNFIVCHTKRHIHQLKNIFTKLNS